jgi:hypothetical protein
MKPGWQTTEFWTTVFTQVLSLAVLLGFVTAGDSSLLEDAVSKAITAVATLVTNGLVIWRYIESRVRLKTRAAQPAVTPPSVGVGLAIAVLLCGGALASAEQRPTGSIPAAATTPAALLPWRHHIEKRLGALERGDVSPAPQDRLGNPLETDFLRRRLAELEAELQRLRQGGSQASPPIAQHFHYYAPPKQDLPIAGDPKQSLPIPGAPKQELPVPGAPKQELPAPGAPKQHLAPDGAPKQVFPDPGAPRQSPMPGPTGYQRFTLTPSPISRPPIVTPNVVPWTPY